MNNFFLLRWYRSDGLGKIISVIVGVLLLCLLVSIPGFLITYIGNYDPIDKFKDVCFGGKVEESEKYKPDEVDSNTIPAIAFWLSPDPQDIGDIYRHNSWADDPDDIMIVACVTRIDETIKDNCVYSGGSYIIQHYDATYQVNIFEAHSGKALDTLTFVKRYIGNDCPRKITFSESGPRKQILYAQLEKSDIEALLNSFSNTKEYNPFDPRSILQWTFDALKGANIDGWRYLIEPYWARFYSEDTEVYHERFYEPIKEKITYGKSNSWSCNAWAIYETNEEDEILIIGFEGKARGSNGFKLDEPIIGIVAFRKLTPDHLAMYDYGNNDVFVQDVSKWVSAYVYMGMDIHALEGGNSVREFLVFVIGSDSDELRAQLQPCYP